MNITSIITSNFDQPMIPSEASGKRKASDDNNSSNSNGAPKPKRTRKDNALSTKRKLLNGEEQRGGLVIIRGSQFQPPSSQPSSDSSNALAGPSHPPNKKFRAGTGAAPSTKGKHKSPDEDGAVEEDVRRMEMEADALRRSAHRPWEPLSGGDSLLPLAPRETPKIEQNRAMRGEGSRTPRRASMSSRGKRLSNSFDRAGIITQPHSSVDDASLYKHIDSELPEPDRARQLIILCAARAPLPAPREGKDPPSQPSEKGSKLLQELKDDVLLLLAERKVDMNVMAIGQPGSAANGAADVRVNEQNVNNRTRTARFKDEIRIAKAEDDAWSAVAQFYNAYQEPVVRELEQRQKAKGKQRADPEGDLRISELPTQFQEASNLALSVLARDATTGGHSPNSHQWSELLYKTDDLHALINTAIQTANVAETDLDRRFTRLSHILRARTQRTAGLGLSSAQPALSTYLPRRPGDPSDSQNLFRALARVDAARPPAQVGAAASRAAREVLRAQDAPVSERRLTAVAPPTPRTPRRPSTPGRGR
ncbi:Mis12-Mtw1 protein family-domain-containing protein [Multifurca ochricompacta]|uniref:Mis12-Mtw1 protein family-domain-containing protein n=1 Tax=Multifurca ochricompacta TaxID=376703 RepID=A0AAD4QM82_9AGAM|nr:Mis12-Mtw1 protein family-domain-containing protein [Multifurca ochricompacta]